MDTQAELKKYCHTNGATVFEVFLKAYADYIGKPVSVGNRSRVMQHAMDYERNKRVTDIPHYAKVFLEKERKRQLALDV